MKKFIIIGFIALISACHKPNYNALDAAWTPDYDLNRSQHSIAEFEKQDQEKMPLEGGIVFVGSSTFTMWKNVKQDLAPLPIINRGFGGNTLPEVLHYADQTIFKYKPKTVVIYSENDMFGAKAKSPEQVRDAYVALTKVIHEKAPNAYIYGVSLKPSPSRWNKKADVEKANQLIQNFIKKDKRHTYIDIVPVMLKGGRPDPGIFLKDSLHMNQEGYRRWTEVLKPVLSKKV